MNGKYFLIVFACSPDNVLPTSPCQVALQTADRNDQGSIECTAYVDSGSSSTGFVLSMGTSSTIPTIGGTLSFNGSTKLGTAYDQADVTRDAFTIQDGQLSATVSQCPSCATVGTASVTFGTFGETVEGGLMIVHGRLVLGFDDFTGPSSAGTAVVDF